MGTPGNDTIVGKGASDVIDGGGGNDEAVVDKADPKPISC
jgi:Ca2+-binding RTX toxin-like protein